MDIDPFVLKKVSANPKPRCESCEDVSETSVAYCFVCQILYCQTCWNYHQRISPTKANKSIPLDDVLQQTKNNQEPVAPQAKLRTEHVLGMTAEAAMKQSPAVVTAYNGFQAEVDKIKNAKAEGEKIKENIQQRRKQVESDINAAFAKLHKIVDKRKNDLLSQTCDAAVSKETRLAIQLEGLHQLEMAMNECHDLTKKSKSQEDWSQVKVRAEQLLPRFSETSLELCENAIQFLLRLRRGE